MKLVIVVFATMLVVLRLPLIDAASGVTIDAFTQRGGHGLGVSSAPFKVGEMVRLYAEVMNNGIPVEGALFGCLVYAPADPNHPFGGLSGVTNASGIGETGGFRIGCMCMDDWEEKLLGTWRIEAYVGVNGEAGNDSLTFECDWDLAADFFLLKPGVDQGSSTYYEPFRAGEVVCLYGRVTNRTVPVPNMPLDFTVYEFEHEMNFSQYKQYAALTNQSGLGRASFRLPWRIESNYSIWCMGYLIYGEYILRHDLAFECLAGERIVGDINYDMKVDITDLAICSRSFGSYTAHVRWNPECDLNDDGCVDIKDVSRTSANFGRAS